MTLTETRLAETGHLVDDETCGCGVPLACHEDLMPECGHHPDPLYKPYGHNPDREHRLPALRRSGGH